MDLQVEGIAELVRLGLVGALVPDAEAVELVLAHLVLGELAEEVGEGVGADAPDALRRQLVSPFLGLDEARLLQHAGQFGQPLQRPGGIVAEQVAHAVDVGLGQRAR
jgi:hypothetical protein